VPSGVTTDETLSHLTKPLKRQVIGYSHSTKLAKDASQVAGYVARFFDSSDWLAISQE